MSYAPYVTAGHDPSTDEASVFIDWMAEVDVLVDGDGVSVTGASGALKAVADAIYTVLDEEDSDA